MHIEESPGYLRDSQDPPIEEYYRKHANRNPLTTVILELFLDIKGNTPKNYEELPETLGSYLRSRVYKDVSSTQTLTASGLTFVQAILKMMQGNGRKAQALDDYPLIQKFAGFVWNLHGTLRDSISRKPSARDILSPSLMMIMGRCLIGLITAF